MQWDVTAGSQVNTTGPEEPPHLFITSLPLQGKSLVLDEARRRLLDQGHFCIAVTYAGTTPVDDGDVDFSRTGSRFWRRVIRALGCYVGTDRTGWTNAFERIDVESGDGFYTFTRYKELLASVWQTLRRYHLRLPMTPGPLVILVDDFTLLLDRLHEIHGASATYDADLARTVGAITNSYDGVSMAFTGSRTMDSIAGHRAIHVPLAPIEMDRLVMLTDLMLMFSLQSKTCSPVALSLSEYNAYKSSVGLLATTLRGEKIQWREQIEQQLGVPEHFSALMECDVGLLPDAEAMINKTFACGCQAALRQHRLRLKAIALARVALREVWDGTRVADPTVSRPPKVNVVDEVTISSETWGRHDTQEFLTMGLADFLPDQHIEI